MAKTSECLDATCPLKETGQDAGDDPVRSRLGLWSIPVFFIGTALSIFQLYTAFRGTYVSLVQGSIHVGAAMGMIFLLYPVSRSRAARPGVPWYDVILASLAILTNLYIVFSYSRLQTHALIFGYSTTDYIVSMTGIVLILEGTRRSVGLPLVLVAIGALTYSAFGNYLPILTHGEVSLEILAAETFLTTKSVFGTPIQVSTTYIYLFLFFGVILIRSGIGEYFSDVAFSLTGRFQGGTAKAAVVASALQGTVSGSSVSNTVASGSFTIPMMKRAGFRPEFAGATEAAASTGGQILPPVMGAAGFIIAAFTGVPYKEVMITAAVPAVLYFTAVFASVHFEAGRTGVVGMAKEQLPDKWSVLGKLYLFAPLAIIIYTLLSGYTATYAALMGIGSAFVISFASRSTKIPVREIVYLLEAGARIALPVIAACATAGIVAGTVTMTGVGGKLAGAILDLSGSHLLLVLLFTMIVCLLLGMGLPTTANYIVTATIAVPILASAFDIPLLASHIFVFYFGVLADITPPVCLAAYAAAGIAQSNPMKTGAAAFKLGVAGFLVPYVLVTSPSLVFQGEHVWAFVPVFITTALGVVVLAACLTGYLIRPLVGWLRLCWTVIGIGLVVPNIFISSAAFFGLVIAFAVELARSRRQ